MFRGERPPGGKWTAKDAQAALLLAEYEAGLCGGCGLPRHTTTDPATFGRWEVEPVVCFACEERDVKAKKVADNDANRSAAAFSYVVKLGPPRRQPRF